MTLDEAIEKYGTSDTVGTWVLPDGRWLTAPMPHAELGDPYVFMEQTRAIRWRNYPFKGISMCWEPTRAQAQAMAHKLKGDIAVDVYRAGQLGPTNSWKDAEYGDVLEWIYRLRLGTIRIRE